MVAAAAFPMVRFPLNLPVPFISAKYELLGAAPIETLVPSSLIKLFPRVVEPVNLETYPDVPFDIVPAPDVPEDPVDPELPEDPVDPELPDVPVLPLDPEVPTDPELPDVPDDPTLLA